MFHLGKIFCPKRLESSSSVLYSRTNFPYLYTTGWPAPRSRRLSLTTNVQDGWWTVMNVEKPLYGLTSFMLALHVSSAMMGYRNRLILLCFAACSGCVINWCRDGVNGVKVHSDGKRVVNGFGALGSFIHVPSNRCRVFVSLIVTRFVVIDWLLYQIAFAMASWTLVLKAKT